MGKQLFPSRSRLSDALFLPCLVVLATPLGAQIADTAPLEARIWRMGNAHVVDFPEPSQRTEGASASTVSADQLRHPLPGQARQMLQKALHSAESGDHNAAIQQLTETVAKYPESAVWVHPLLGVELLKTDQFAAAVKSFEQAVALLPRDPVNRSNLGLSLAAIGKYDRAMQELRRALELDSNNATIRQLLDVVEAYNRLPHHD